VAAYRAQWSSGISAVWRGLSWKQYKDITNRTFDCPMSSYLEACRAAVVWARFYSIEVPVDTLPAGVLQFIGQQLLDHSPFNTRKDNLELVRSSLGSARRAVQGDFLQSARALIAHAFRYTFEEIDGWDAETFYLRYAQAEMATGRSINPVDTSEKPKPGERPQRKKRELTDGQKEVLERMKNIHR
jgi:hypothetical protein